MPFILSIRLLAVMMLSFSFTDCRKEKSEAVSTNSTPGTPAPIDTSKKFLALGDSYTIGQSVPSIDRFPDQTKTWLQGAGVSISTPDIIAATGWTTYNLMDAINAANPPTDYSIVTLLIGVNDQYQFRDTTNYRLNFTNLLYRAIALAGARRNRVFVISIPDYSITPFARFSDTATIRKQIDWFNAINRQVTTQNSCSYLDITPSTRESLLDHSLLCPDSLHPSGKEYRKWAERLGPIIKANL